MCEDIGVSKQIQVDGYDSRSESKERRSVDITGSHLPLQHTPVKISTEQWKLSLTFKYRYYFYDEQTIVFYAFYSIGNGSESWFLSICFKSITVQAHSTLTINRRMYCPDNVLLRQQICLFLQILFSFLIFSLICSQTKTMINSFINAMVCVIDWPQSVFKPDNVK